MTTLDTYGYHIKLNKISQENLSDLMGTLTVSPAENIYGGDDVVTYEQYKMDTEEIIIPKMYGIENYGVPRDSRILYSPESVELNFNGTLRDYQEIIVSSTIEKIKTTYGAMIEIPCGRGKTLCAIYIACALKLKTLVVVHKSFLQKQWINQIKTWTGEDCGVIRQKKSEVDGYKFVVGMIQSISSRDYGDIYKDFGLVICDETHHYASRYFSGALSKISTKYTLGLSATMYRNDGLIHVVNWYLGDVAYSEKMKPNNQVCAKIINYVSTDKTRFIEVTRNIKGRGTFPNHVKMIGNIVEIDDRNNLIVQIINELRKDPYRKILVLSGRKETHLHKLKESVDNLLDNAISNGEILKNEVKSYLYTGDTKENDRTLAEQYADILFATYSMAAEGLDIPRLNTIILASPKKDVVQSVGRILRKILETGDIRPLIIDIADNLSLFKSQLKIRETLYKKNKYIVQHYFAKDNSYVDVQGTILNDVNHADVLNTDRVDFEQALKQQEQEEQEQKQEENQEENKQHTFAMFESDSE